MIDVRRLRLLAELDRRGTVAAVAEHLHLTPSGVSMQLAALERETGLPLTERRGRRLALTPGGRLLAEHAHAVLDRLQVAELEVAALRDGLGGEYRLAAFPSAARTFVARAWGELLARGSGPTLRLETLEPEEAVPAVLGGAADLAVVHAYSDVASPRAADLAARELLREPVLLAVPGSGAVHWAGAGAEAGSATDGPVDLAAFADAAWVAPPEGMACAGMVERACGRAGFRPRVVARSVDFGAQLALVARGVGVALVPDLTVDVLPEGVALRRLARPVHRTSVLVTRVALAGDPGARAVGEALEGAAAATARDRGWALA